MPHVRDGAALRLQALVFVSLTMMLCGLALLYSGEASSATTPAFMPGLLARVPNSNVVYVFGESSCHGRKCLQLLRTSVDATSFTTVTPPPVHLVTGNHSGDLRELVFANAREGYAVVGANNTTTVYATTNAARTWRRVKVAAKDDVVDLTSSAHELYAVTVRCPTENGNCTDFRLARSSLGARHWTSSALPHGDFTKGGFLGDLAVYGSRVWFTEQFHTTLLYSSKNEGRTFTRRTLAWPTLASVAGCALSASSPTSLWAQCPTGMQVSYYASSNGGATWTSILGNLQKMGTGGVYFDPVSSTLAVLDVGLGSNDLYRIPASARDVTPIGHLGCYSVGPSFVFTDVSHALAICDPSSTSSTVGLERTDNGGVTWVPVTVESTSAPVPNSR